MQTRNSSQSLLTAAVAALVLGASPMAMGQAAGQVLFVKGDVQIIGADGARRAARQGDTVQEGERMVTGPGAMGQVKMADGGFVGVRPASGVRFEPQQGSAPRSMALTAGQVRVLNVDAGNGAVPYVLKTPHGELRMSDADAQAGILPVAPGEDGTVRTVVKLNRGTGTALDRTGTPLEMTGGDAVSVRPGAAAPQQVAAIEVPELATRDLSRVAIGTGAGSGGTAGGGGGPRVPSPGRAVRVPDPIAQVFATTGRLPTVQSADGSRPSRGQVSDTISKALGNAEDKRPPKGLPVPSPKDQGRLPTAFAATAVEIPSASRVSGVASTPPPPVRVVDPIVLTAFTQKTLPRIEFTRDSDTTLDTGVRRIVSAASGTRPTQTTTREPTITSLRGTTILAPTRTGSLTGTFTGTRTLTPTTTVKSGTITLRR